MAASVPEEPLALYTRVAKQRGTGVAEARDGMCQSCHVRMRVQIWVEVRKNEQIFQCESCSRVSSTSRPRRPSSSSLERRSLRLHVDGASRGNPGEAGFGVHVTAENGTEVASLYGYLGKATNNVAEYQALLHGLRFALARGASRVEVFSDSELLVRQIEGRYRVKNAGLQPLHREAQGLLARFERVPRRPRPPRAEPRGRRAGQPRGGRARLEPRLRPTRRKPTKLIIRPAAFPSRR